MSDAPPPRIAYLTTEYPKVSHTFIRREILGLEQLGYAILRVSIRPAGAVADPVDQLEQAKTVYCLGGSKAGLLLGALRTFLRHPLRSVSAKMATFAMSKMSERGLMRHMAYWVEGAWLADLLRREKVDHVHVHFGTNAAPVARLSRIMGGPTYSMTIHGPSEFDAPIGLSLGDKMRDAAFTVAITDFCASQLRRWVDYTQWHKIKIVHCTVGEEWLDAATPVAKDAQTLVFVGRLNEQKGPLFLVDAFADAADQGMAGTLVIVGDGELREAVESRIDARGLRGRVIITGWQNESQVRDHLLKARALVLPSFAEGLPVVIMEALALGRPVISTYIAGIPELVKPGESGWLVAAGNVGDLCAAMMAAMDADTDELTRMGETGRAAVRDHHVTATEAAKLDALFRDAVARRAH